MNLGSLDLAVVAIYAIVLLVLAQWVSREKAGHKKDSSDYFLAGRALPWWAIGASLIAANISTEQFVGMSGGDIGGDQGETDKPPGQSPASQEVI